jgi:rhamnose transport system permease protein
MGTRERSLVFTIAALFSILAIVAPAYFATDNLRDLLLANLPVLIIALGATLIILTGNIDISIGSVFAVCGVVAGVLAKAGAPIPIAGLGAVTAGAAMGAINGSLVAYAGIPAIVDTLATMIAWRDGLRWVTQGAWVHDLPPAFQWLGLTQTAFPFFAGLFVLVILACAIFLMRHMAWGRFVYAVGSSREAARLAGLHTPLIVFTVFVIGGALTGVAAMLNAVRFNQIPSNAGLGLEMKVIAAVVVGGTTITGGRGSLLGTLLGVVLMGAIGPALTFMGINAYWERAIHGAIILSAVAADALRAHLTPAGAPARPSVST